jgi:hypothetical protein
LIVEVVMAREERIRTGRSERPKRLLGLEDVDGSISERISPMPPDGRGVRDRDFGC